MASALLGRLARGLRSPADLAETKGVAEQEYGLKLPQQRIVERLSGLAYAAGKVLVSVGSGIASLLPRGERYGVTKPVLKTAGPPPRVPQGRRVYAVGDVHGRADLLIRLMTTLREDIARGEFEGKAGRTRARRSGG